MYLNNTKISHSKLVQMFSDVFDGKVLGVVSELVISPDVYNGKCKLFDFCCDTDKNNRMHL